MGSLNLTQNAESPSTCTFTLKNLTPSFGNDVKLAFARPNDYWFGGTLLQTQVEYIDAANYLYHCTAVGYEWLLDRYTPVLAQYQNRAVNHIVADILARFTNGSFRVGYCPSSFGNLDMQFTYENVYGALQRIAKAVGARVDVTPDRVVNVYVTYPDAAYTALTTSLVELQTYSHDFDLTQVRTRALYQGRGSTATQQVPLASVTLPVADTQPFSTTGGTAVSGRNQITYTGLSATSGPGSLTGVTGISYDIAENDAVDVLAIATDVAKDALLAILLGGGMSGQATSYRQDGRLSLNEATARATEEIDLFGEALTHISFTYLTYVRHLKVGRQLGVISPASGTFTIQTIRIQPYGPWADTHTQFFQRVELAPFKRSVSQLLGVLAASPN